MDKISRCSNETVKFLSKTTNPSLTHNSEEKPNTDSLYSCYTGNVLSNCKRKLRIATNGISKISLLLLVTLCLFGRISGDVQLLPVDLSKIPTPPSFIHPPNADKIYYVVEQVIPSGGGGGANNGFNLETAKLKERLFSCRATGYPSVTEREYEFRCEATGYPNVTYKWLKNGNEFQLDNIAVSNRILRIPGDGSFKFGKLTADDEGKYECVAENGNGTAIDKPIYFLRTSLTSLIDTLAPEDVKYSEPFQKDCPAPRSVPPPRVYWILTTSGSSPDRRQFLTINHTNIAVNDKGTIFFQYVRDEDNHANFYYTCVAENMESKDIKFGLQFNFNILRPPGSRTSLEPYIVPELQYVSPEKLTVLQGHSLELFCIYSGFPDVIPTWSKPSGGEIDFSRVSWGTNFKKSIKIDNIHYEDEGTYVCEESKRMIKHSFVVTVDAAPYWVAGQKTANVNSSEGSDVEFVCNAHGRPMPTFLFYKNGLPLQSDAKHEISGSRLLIKDIRKGDQGTGDNAVYQCKASNVHGSVWTNFYLNILAFAPVILRGPKVVETVEGKNVKMECVVFGSPMPQAFWSSHKLLGTSTTVEKPVQSDGSTSLELENVEKKHEGTYTCAFKNLYNTAEESGTLIVRNRTFIKKMPELEPVSIGKPLQLNCSAEHDSSLKVRYVWKSNNLIIEPNDRIKIENNGKRLVVANPTGFDSGSYTCIAETDFDKDSSTIQVVVRDIPPSPSGLKVECSEETATIRFYYQEKSTVAVPAYKWFIQYNIDPAEPDSWDTYIGQITWLENGVGTAAVSLFPFGQFKFRVFAQNSIGTSLAAYPIEVKDGSDGRCVTLPKAPIRSPANVEIKDNVGKALIVNWEPVPRRDWYGPGFGYEIQYKKADEDDSQYKTKAIEDPYQDSATIHDDIKPYEKYDVVVRSKNDLGYSQPSQTITGRSGEEAPDVVPKNFACSGPEGPSTARFTWEPVEEGQVKGEFKYKIVHWVQSAKRSEPIMKEAYFDSKAVHGVIYDLKPNKKNSAKIMVYNNAGDGPPSDTISFEMPEGVPTPVQNVSVFPLSDTEIGILFKPPRETNGNLTGYVVRVCPIKDDHVDNSECKEKKLQADDLTEARITNLSAATPYRVEVFGTTGSGEGDPISPDTETNTTIFFEHDQPSDPLQPTLENVQIGHDHINVTWKPGLYVYSDEERRKPPGNRFRIIYRPDGESEWKNATAAPTHDGFTITVPNLSPSTKYEIKSVSVHRGAETTSAPYFYTTMGEPSSEATIHWLIAIIIAIIILVIILIIVCLVVRNRGAKYPVSEKEKEQGREPMLKDERGFGEYARPDIDEEKRSLTAESLKPESETDSMAEYGDGETGRFTEDGSFIGQYGAANKTTAPERGKPNLSTFV